MLYTPIPGTPLHAQVAAEGRLLPDVDFADMHGQFKFNFRHQAISHDESKELLDRAFQLDFERNGPSLYRLIRTMHQRWQRYGSDADPRVRARVAVAAKQLRGGYGAALWAMERYLRGANPDVSERIRVLRMEIEREFGVVTAAVNRVLGPALLWTSRRDARRGRSSSRARSWSAADSFVDPAHAGSGVRGVLSCADAHARRRMLTHEPQVRRRTAGPNRTASRSRNMRASSWEAHARSA